MCRARLRGRAPGRPAPASGSAPRWTRRMGRSCDSIAAKSPAAWASMSWPKRVRPARDLAVVAGGRPSAAGTSRSARRPCGAGRSSAGSAGRSRPSWRGGCGRAGSARIRGIASSRPGVGRDERLEREVGVRLAAREMSGAVGDDAASASSGAAARRRGVVASRSVARPRCGRPCASTSRVSCLASSTLGWSNGSMPRTAPAIAVATSQRTNSPPRSIGSATVDADHRVPGCLEGVGERVAAAVRAVRQGDPDERPVVAVALGGAERLEVDRHDPDAVLAGALRDELLRPRPE